MTASDSNHQSSEPYADRWQALIAGYVLGDLEPDEIAEVQQYLVQNPQAQNEVAALETALNLIPLSLPVEASPPASLHRKLIDSALVTPQQQQIASAAPEVLRQSDSSAPEASFSTGKPRQKWLLLGAIVTTLTTAMLSFQNLQLRNQLQLTNQRVEQLAAVENQLAAAKADVADYQQVLSMLRLPQNRLLTLTGASDFTLASGSVIIAPQRNWAMLTLKGIPTPPVGKAYQLWAIANGEKVYCVEFKPDEAGQVLVEIPVDRWAETPMVSITVEDEGTIPTQTSEMVMNGSVI